MMFLDFLILANATVFAPLPANQVVTVSKMEVWYPPKDNPTDRIVGLINGAQRSIWVQAYQLTAQPIADALIEAFKRGVKIIIIVDRTQTGGASCAPKLAQLGLEIWIDHKPPIAHNKVFIIDEQHVICGSFNYSKNATKNAENCVIFIKERGVAALYLSNVKRRLDASEKFADHIPGRKKKITIKKSVIVQQIVSVEEKTVPIKKPRAKKAKAS